MKIIELSIILTSKLGKTLFFSVARCDLLVRRVMRWTPKIGPEAKR